MEAVAPHGIEAKHPDELLDIAPSAVLTAVAGQAADLRSPPRSVSELLDTLERSGLPRSVARLREILRR